MKIETFQLQLDRILSERHAATARIWFQRDKAPYVGIPLGDFAVLQEAARRYSDMYDVARADVEGES